MGTSVSPWSVADWLLYGRAIAEQPVNSEPVFILGHPRTGGVAAKHVHPKVVHECVESDIGHPAPYQTFHFTDRMQPQRFKTLSLSSLLAFMRL